MSRPMNDDEVAGELNKMVAFIRQEAMEKAREIKVKADEDFNIEKAKIVRAETLAIDAEYAKKRKQAETALKIAQSTQTNKSRLKLLHAREQYLSDLFTNARNQLLELSKDEQKYEDLLKGIIVQGLLSLLEPSATVSAREKDVALVEKAIQAAQAEYKEISGRDVEVKVETDLPENSAGGVRLISGNRRITIDNTLDERLRLLEDRMLPEIRTDLFGKNENRKFYS
ncbi:V-type proton ATPase subunit E 1 OS=Bos taurus GN=ATP6V1E1 PE=2 SV=1 [Rhizoctonia solani AG-1 IB]|uniref:V-type H+-transporting ATPase subunit E n=1 Tax=Thanatephorus cucumeris (strain AG1-IB / isolate 7/3/14) TaxID=1108050 RepID=M5BZX7_THACB|nr:V-type H+-transporting ATPase subunit E [Rhizoctonia solani AG-1 IB]CEL54729.1 V-type proton ATPase subunit E 1 OS=Bos taurus GN=ATP6V1E1 PE=2 SV=1 [Rhizoctonia solani AG-1 IB]